MLFAERFCNNEDVLKNKKFIVAGDFCLDKYIYLDSKLDQKFDYSDLETYFITYEKCYPGGAGNVAKNLLTMGATVICIGLIGKDGNGYDLKRVLEDYGADINYLYEYDSRTTNTYYRPIRRSDKKDNYMNELLFINPELTREDQENSIIDAFERTLNGIDGVVIVEQFARDSYSTVTSKIKRYINSIADKYSNKFFLVDSRSNIDKYRNVFIKCNQFEFMNTMCIESSIEMDKRKSILIAMKKYINKISNRGIYITLGEKGMVYGDKDVIATTDAFSIIGEIDTCGAGDSASVGIIIALCTGYTEIEAMIIGNLCAYVTAKQIGSTGTLTYERLINAYKELDNGLHS
jgi:ADP-heptose synthase, bifunctional sugar kinase/adenylyltransferase